MTVVHSAADWRDDLIESTANVSAQATAERVAPNSICGAA
jgi:hypothetical protein